MNNYRQATTASPAFGSADSSAALELRQRVHSWLAASVAISASGDAGFSDDGEQRVSSPKPLKPAAVLLLVIAHEPTPTVLFTQRTAHLTDHAGQISFPGGRVEEQDRDAHHTALRETAEETGVDADAVEVIGTLPRYTTGTGYLITPVVGMIVPPVSLKPDPTEVEDCFEVPLDFLLDHRNHRRESAMYKGRMREYYAIPYQHRYIWGATAGMLITFSSVVAHAQGAPSIAPVRMSLDSGA
jgi:8-oxo-dGTP pyrophosphatase MutT (NUDIX family)